MIYLQKLFMDLIMNLSYLPRINWIDIIVVISLFRGGYIGLVRGFSVELFKLIGMVATAILTVLYYESLSLFLASHSFLPLEAANVVSVVFLFASLLLIFKLVRVLLFRVLHLELFGSLEKWGGCVLGFLRGFVFASLLLFVITLLPIEYAQKSIDEKSFLGPRIKQIVPQVTEFAMKFRPKD